MVALIRTFGLRVMICALLVSIHHVNCEQPEGAASGTATGYLASFVSSYADGSDVTTYYLREDKGALYRLSFCKNVDTQELRPNSHVSVTYTDIADGVMSSCQPPLELSVPPAAQNQTRRSLYGDTIDSPTEPSFLIYITTFCGYSGEASATQQIVYDMFGVNSSATDKLNMADYYDTCSYGRVAVQPTNVRVVGPVEIPCSAQLDLLYNFPSGNTLDTQSCGRDNLLKWQYYLDDWAQRKHRIVPTDYHHKVMILPKKFTLATPDCNRFTGQASIGPNLRQFSPANNWGTGLVWLAGEALPNLEPLFHELGHNLGMAHADVAPGAPGANCGLGDQCDNNCPMGARGVQGIRCWNAPHMWQIGWGRPSRQLRDADLPRGVPQRVTLPPYMSTRTSSLMVSLPGPGIDPDIKLYLSARINAQPYDLPFSEDQDGEPFLTVHAYSGSPVNFYRRTFLLATLAPGEIFVHNASGLVVAFTDWQPPQGQDQGARQRKVPQGQQTGTLGGGGASAVLCRRQGAKEQVCGDGIDDDCDLLPDHLDPDCAGRMGGNGNGPVVAKPSADASPGPAPMGPGTGSTVSMGTHRRASPPPPQRATIIPLFRGQQQQQALPSPAAQRPGPSVRGVVGARQESLNEGAQAGAGSVTPSPRPSQGGRRLARRLV